MESKGFQIAADGLDFSNRPQDVPTFHIDGSKGVMVTPEGAKVSFFETLSDPISEKVVGRFAVNLAMPTSQLLGLADHLSRIAADIRKDGAEPTVSK